MTGKTLTIKDILQPQQVVKVPVVGQQAVVEESGDIDLITLIEKINAFISNINHMIYNVKDLINNLVENAESLHLPPAIVEKIARLKFGEKLQGNTPPTQLIPTQQFNPQLIVEYLKKLPPNMTVEELVKLAESVIGGGDVGSVSQSDKGKKD